MWVTIPFLFDLVSAIRSLSGICVRNLCQESLCQESVSGIFVRNQSVSGICVRDLCQESVSGICVGNDRNLCRESVCVRNFCKDEDARRIDIILYLISL